MITSITLQNYRSIWSALVELQPFTLLIGANGTGKSNFLKLLQDINDNPGSIIPYQGSSIIKRKYLENSSTRHVNHQSSEQLILFNAKSHDEIKIYSLDPSAIGKPESVTLNPTVESDGSGAVQVLDALKTGDREDLFQKIESTLTKYVPEIEKLSFKPMNNAKKLQVRERHIDTTMQLSDLSEGTRLILTILTIIYQENPPKVICLEDIDKGLHPRLFQKLIDLCFEITEEKDIQIIATTHNPYLVNKFYGHEDAVIIVEKENGETKFTTLEERLEGLDVQEEDPLGELWYSGFVGGVPEVRRPVR